MATAATATTDWKSVIRNDKRYLKFESLFEEQWKPALDSASIADEVRSLHDSRKIAHLLNVKENMLDELVNVCLQDAANRGRLCRIKLDISNITVKVESHLDSLTSYLTTRYTDTLDDAGIRTIAARKQAMESLGVFPEVNQWLAALNSASEDCNIVLNDIDQAAFTLQKVLKAVEISSAREKV